MACLMPQTLSNLADAQVALGEAALAAGQPAEGQAAFEAALQSYQASCALSNSANGAVNDWTGMLPLVLCAQCHALEISVSACSVKCAMHGCMVHLSWHYLGWGMVW